MINLLKISVNNPLKIFSVLLLLIISCLQISCSSGSSSSSASTVAPSEWLQQLGVDNATTLSFGVAKGADDSAYVVGTTSFSLDGQTQSGHFDSFIAKYNASGSLIWLRQLGASNGFTIARSVAVATDGSIYVSGATTVGIGEQIQNGGFDAFIAKYDSNGNLSFVRQLGEDGDEIDDRVAIAANDNIYITGSTSVSLDGQTQNGNFDAFIAKYDSSGNLVLVRQIGAESGTTNGLGVSLFDGSVYITGGTTVGLADQALTGTRDAFIAKYTESGDLTLVRQLGSTVEGAETQANSINVAIDGTIYIAGTTSAGLGQLALIGTNDAFVAKYDANATLSRLMQNGTSGIDTSGESIKVAADGSAYLAGSDGNLSDGENIISRAFIQRLVLR